MAKRPAVAPQGPAVPLGPRAATLPPSMFDGNFNSVNNVTMISTTPLSVVTSTTTIGTLGAISDPELVRFQNELDRRYFNLNKKEEVKVSQET